MSVACVILAEQTWGGTLHACRSLTKRGIPTHVAVAGAGARVYESSRFCVSAAELDDTDAAAYCSELRHWVEQEVIADSVVLLPSSDRLVDFLNQERNEFGTRYRLGLPEHDVAARLLSKPTAFELAERAGLHVPPWRRVASAADIPTCGDLRLPVVIRPSSWATQGSEPFKVMTAHTRTECDAMLHRLVGGGADVVVQERVGDVDATVEFGLCVRSRRRRPPVAAVVCTGVKHREASDDGGVMVWGSATDLPQTRAATTRFVEATSFTGLGGSEFIHSNGVRWFIEFNPRLEAITFLATQAGVDLVSAEFDDLADTPSAPSDTPFGPQRAATAWVGSAWLARLTSPSGSLAEAIADRVRFARSPNRVTAVWSLTDPGPGVRVTCMLAAGALRRTAQRLRGQR